MCDRCDTYNHWITRLHAVNDGNPLTGKEALELASLLRDDLDEYIDGSVERNFRE